MADVFVSYARGDQQLAEKISSLLISAGFSTWWDSELLPHNRFASAIEDEIRAARAVLVIWSQAAVRSQWVRAEAELAREQGKLIQVAIDQSPLPLPFNQYQTADLGRWNGKASDPQWRKVLASISYFTTAARSVVSEMAGTEPQPIHSESRWLRRPSRALLYTSATILGLTALGGAFIYGAGRGEARGNRIAIQPFRTIGATPAVQNFAAELSNSLQNTLTQDQLQTVSPAEAETLKGDDLAPRLKRLDVGLMFSGTVEPKGADLAVSMRLDDPVQHATLWTAELTGPAAQSDQLRARVGALTVAVLNCSAQGLAPNVRLSDTALQAFLHACELSETAGHGDAGGSAAYAMLNAMRQATREAPKFAAGHSMLAKHLAYVIPSMPANDADAFRSEAGSEARRALELDPQDPDAFVTFGLLAPNLDFAQRESQFRKALASNPAWPHANGFLGSVMSDVGRHQDALMLYQRAGSVNPLSDDWASAAADGLVNVGRTEEADRELARISQLWPNVPYIWYAQIDSMVAQKRWGDALKLLDNAANFGSAVSPDRVARRRALFAALQSGNAADREALRHQLLTLRGAQLETAIDELGMLGFVDDAFAVAEHLSPAKSDSPSFLFQPEMTAVRNDPRFMGLAARFGLVDYWRDSGHWPDFCSKPDLPYNCAREAQTLRPF